MISECRQLATGVHMLEADANIRPRGRCSCSTYVTQRHLPATHRNRALCCSMPYQGTISYLQFKPHWALGRGSMPRAFLSTDLHSGSPYNLQSLSSLPK